MSLTQFKHSRKGAKVGAILTSPAAIRTMERKSDLNRPAVEAVGARIAAEVGELGDDERKYVGRWVKELLAPRGFVPDRKGRVAEGNLFARGTIYRRIGQMKHASPRRSGAERLAAARAILATMPHPIMSSEELIAERHKAFESE